MNKINVNDVEIDSFSLEDVIHFTNYWHDTPKEFWEERGVTPNILISREEHIERLKKRVLSDSICSVIFKSQRIGVHILSHREEKSALMHSHYWKANYRGLGIGTIAYVKAMEWFFSNAELKKIIFKTPKKNIAANRIKDKLGIKALGEVMYKGPKLKNSVPAFLYEVNEENLQNLRSKLPPILAPYKDHFNIKSGPG